MDSKDTLYQKLFSTYKNCYHEKKPQDCQKDVNILGTDFKKKHENNKEFFEAVETKIKDLNELLHKKKASVTFFFSKVMFYFIFVMTVSSILILK